MHTHKNRKINNVISDHGSWIEVDVSTKKHPDVSMKIDKDDWHSISKICTGHIHVVKSKRRKVYYCVGRFSVGSDNRFRCLVHRMILNPHGIVDHINHDGTDNRRFNLRECTNSENMMNSLVRTNNKTGFRGVYNFKRDNNFAVQICVNYKKITLDER